MKELQDHLCEQNLRDVEVRRKGVGRSHSWMNLIENDSSSANRLGGGDGEFVEVVSLDEDIEEPVTLIKMDIEGAEYDALLGAERIIREQKPKLAVCLYHGYDDLWRLPLLIDGMNQNYRFYLRHNGGNLIPTEFVLLRSPEREKLP